MHLASLTWSRAATTLTVFTVLAGSAQSATYTVINTNNSGAGSLRQAILDANALPGSDTIQFDATVFATPKAINLATELTVADHLTINGPTAALTLSGQLLTRIVNISGPGTLAVTINKVRFSLGASTNGGAIFVQGENLTLNDATVVFCSASNNGGAVYLTGAGAVLTANRCSFQTNSATFDGGAICANATATITLVDSTISSNEADFGEGGGLYMDGGGALSVTGCTFAANAASTSGGAVYASGLLSPGLIRNSTLSGNTANTDGGALRILNNSGVYFLVWNSTLASNMAGGTGGALSRGGGGAVPINIESSIVFGNTSGSSGPAIFTAGTVNASTSLVSSSSGVTTWSADGFTNANLGVDPLLGALGNNGGLTQTRAISAASPAIDAGSNPAGLTTDQRGVGYARSSHPACPLATAVDIGAFEAQCPCAALPVAYCTAGTTTNGCVPSISSTGAPSASAPSGCTVSVSSVEGQKQGILFYGINGRHAAVWAPGSSSYLCVKTPTQRSAAQNSGGTNNACDGVFSLDVNLYWTTHPSALGQPLAAGQLVNVQAWFRDPPAPGTTNLSNGLELTLCP